MPPRPSARRPHPLAAGAPVLALVLAGFAGLVHLQAGRFEVKVGGRVRVRGGWRWRWRRAWGGPIGRPPAAIDAPPFPSRPASARWSWALPVRTKWIWRLKLRLVLRGREGGRRDTARTSTGRRRRLLPPLQRVAAKLRLDQDYENKPIPR